MTAAVCGLVQYVSAFIVMSLSQLTILSSAECGRQVWSLGTAPWCGWCHVRPVLCYVADEVVFVCWQSASVLACNDLMAIWRGSIGMWQHGCKLGGQHGCNLGGDEGTSAIFPHAVTRQHEKSRIAINRTSYVTVLILSLQCNVC